ncbi:MAG TPA: hypothetical protein VGE98_12380 [Thermoanaerobaculia bacterium]
MSIRRGNLGRLGLVLVLALAAVAAGCASDDSTGTMGRRGGGGGGRHHRGGGQGRGQAGPGGGGERFVAYAINLGTRGNLPGGQTGTVDIRIDRWSTTEDREALLAALRDGGGGGLLKALQRTKVVGSIRTPDRIGLDLHYAADHLDADGSRRIFLATDRRIGFWEEANQALSTQYPFTLIELHIGADGRGEGKMSVATKITESPDKDHIELENYTSEPVRLQDVRKAQ